METETLTAEKAREIAEQNKITLAYIYEGISAMAKGGYNYAGFDIKKVKDPEAVKLSLESNGFTVGITENNLNVKW